MTGVLRVDHKALVERVAHVAEQPHGQFVSDQRHLIAARRVFLRSERAAGERRRTENVEEVAAHALGGDLVDAVASFKICNFILKCGNAGEAVIRVAQEREIRQRDVTALRTSADPGKLSCIFIRKRAEQNGVSDGEDCCVCTNSECEGGDREGGKAGRIRHHSQAIAQVAEESVQGASPIANLS